VSLRIGVASLIQEGNSFSPLPTTLESFESGYLLRGPELLTGYRDARVEVPGFLSVLAGAGATPVPLLAGCAASGGALTRATFAALLGEVESRLRAASRVDGLLLALHGALLVEDEPEGDAAIIERLRRVLPSGTPIGISLDLHGHVTPRMLQPDCFLVSYQTYPHVDIFETGQRVARLLLDVLAGRRRPVMALAKRPIVLSAAFTRTTGGPFHAIAQAARQMEAERQVLHASLFPVQPWLDVPNLGFAVLACTDADTAGAQAAADRLADLVWDRRTSLEPELVSLEEAIRIGLSSSGCTVVSDSGDCPSAGSAADNPSVLRALLQAGAQSQPGLTYLAICDPAAAAAAARVGPGGSLTTNIGHYYSKGDGEPLSVTAGVRLVSDGEYRVRDAHEFGTTVRMGQSAVLQIGSIRLLVRSKPSVEWETGMYLSQGLDPAEAALIFVKSPSAFRSSFGPVAGRILVADTPGPTCSDMRRIPYRAVTRPLYPLDR
jgi:microcystin degradation protein MlrC